MRPVLIRFVLDRPFAGLSNDPGPLSIGSAWLVLAAAAIYFGVQYFRKRSIATTGWEPAIWFGAAIGISTLVLPNTVADGMSLPVFGYGVMILIGFLAGTAVAQWRLKLLGYDGELAFSMGTWILICGVIGGRLFFLFQHGGEAIGRAPSLLSKLLVIVNLTQGGLVLYGGVFAGLIAFLTFCHRHKIPALRMADVVTPSIFLGIGFGRLGCLLYGCCFGGQCDLPWAVTFPADSIPYNVMAGRGLIEVGQTVALHPTQIYSSVSGFVLAALTGAFFRHRTGDGAVFALGCMTYPLARFLVEFIRIDEAGQLGTQLTISQWISLGVVLAGTVLFFIVTSRGKPAMLATPVTVA